MTQPPGSGQPETGRPDAGPHLDLDSLADLDEGLVEGPRAAAMSGHLESCGACRARQSGLRATQERLRDLPAEPIPDDVAARLDAALTEASVTGPTVLPLADRRRRRFFRLTLPGAAAVFVTLALIGAAVVGVVASNGGTHSPQSNAPDRSTAAGGAASAARYPVVATGRDYTKATIPRMVTRLLGEATPGVAPTVGAIAGVNPRLARLAGSRAALGDCIAALTSGGAAQSPLAVDFARYNGEPAVVVVLPGLLASNVDAWVVGPGCNRQDEHLLLYTSLPRPG